MRNRNIVVLVAALIIACGVAGSAQALSFSYTSLDYPATGVTETKAFDINASGWFVGSYIDGTGTHGFLYDGGYSPVNYPGASATWALGVNDANKVVGRYLDASGAFHGFLYDGSYVTKDFPGALSTELFGINNANQFVGQYTDSTTLHGFLYDSGSYTSIDDPEPGAGASSAMGITDGGEVVGFYGTDVNMHFPHGFRSTDITTPGTYTTVDFPGSAWTRLRGINNNGEIVGRYYLLGGTHQAFYYDGVSFTGLDFPGAVETWAFGINDWADIVGFYKDAGGAFHGYLASPVPEPGSWILIGSGLVALVGLNRSHRG